MKFKVPWPLVSERVVKFFTPLYQFFTKTVIRNVPYQNLCNFLSAVLEKFTANLNHISSHIELVIKLVSKEANEQ